MVTWHLRAKVDANGVLTCTLPGAFREQEVEIDVTMPETIPQETTLSTSEAERKRLVELGYPPDFFEKTFGTWVGESERGNQGEYETREPLD